MDTESDEDTSTINKTGMTKLARSYATYFVSGNIPSVNDLTYPTDVQDDGMEGAETEPEDHETPKAIKKTMAAAAAAAGTRRRNLIPEVE